MLGLWLVFMCLLFVAEPLLKMRLDKQAHQDPAVFLRRLSRFHELLLLLAALTAFGAVAGVHGPIFF